MADASDRSATVESAADPDELALAARPRQRVKFTDETQEAYLDLLREGKRRGQAAREVGIHRSTIADYRKLDAAFAAEERLAEMDAIEAVEESLYQTALAGNVTAQQVFLYNRAPDRWADRRNVQMTGAGGGPIEYADTSPRYHEMTDDELRRREQEAADTLRREGQAAVAEAESIVRRRSRSRPPRKDPRS